MRDCLDDELEGSPTQRSATRSDDDTSDARRVKLAHTVSTCVTHQRHSRDTPPCDATAITE
jgi:hypothetical protein